MTGCDKMCFRAVILAFRHIQGHPKAPRRNKIRHGIPWEEAK